MFRVLRGLEVQGFRLFRVFRLSRGLRCLAV